MRSGCNSGGHLGEEHPQIYTSGLSLPEADLRERKMPVREEIGMKKLHFGFVHNFIFIIFNSKFS